jgi:hypothetical protein
MNWIYLIARNQEKTKNHDIPRLINSFLYSRKGETAIVISILDMIKAFIDVEVFNNVNCETYSNVPSLPGALVTILVKEKGNPGVIGVCLDVANSLFNCTKGDYREICRNFVRYGICEALVSIAEIYILDTAKMEDILGLISIIIVEDWGSHIERFITAGLLTVLVLVLVAKTRERSYNLKIREIVESVYEHDAEIIPQSIEMGMPCYALSESTID